MAGPEDEEELTDEQIDAIVKGEPYEGVDLPKAEDFATEQEADDAFYAQVAAMMPEEFDAKVRATNEVLEAEWNAVSPEEKERLKQESDEELRRIQEGWKKDSWKNREKKRKSDDDRSPSP